MQESFHPKATCFRLIELTCRLGRRTQPDLDTGKKLAKIHATKQIELDLAAEARSVQEIRLDAQVEG